MRTCINHLVFLHVSFLGLQVVRGLPRTFSEEEHLAVDKDLSLLRREGRQQHASLIQLDRAPSAEDSTGIPLLWPQSGSQSYRNDLANGSSVFALESVKGGADVKAPGDLGVQSETQVNFKQFNETKPWQQGILPAIFTEVEQLVQEARKGELHQVAGTEGQQQTQEEQRIENLFMYSVRRQFAMFDADRSGFLEEAEANALKARIDDIRLTGGLRWRAFDLDNDGRLSQRELLEVHKYMAHLKVEDDEREFAKRRAARLQRRIAAGLPVTEEHKEDDHDDDDDDDDEEDEQEEEEEDHEHQS